MKFTSATVILAFVASAIAVTIADLPACSVSCFTSAIASTSCSLTDTQCQCTTGKDAITASVSPCILKVCSQADVATTISVSAQLCQQYSSGTTSSGSSTKSSSTTGKTSTGTATAAAATSNAASIQKTVEMMGAGVCIVAAGMFAL